jgi:hypothetical protein
VRKDDQATSLSIYLPSHKGGADLLERLRRLSTLCDRSVNHVVVDAILVYLDEKEIAAADSRPETHPVVVVGLDKTSPAALPSEVAASDSVESEAPEDGPDEVGTPRTAHAWERKLRPLLTDIELIGELTLSAEEIASLLDCIGRALAPPSFALGLRALAHGYPATYVCGLVFGGLQVYAGGAYWTRFLPRIGLTVCSESEQELGRTFEACLRALRLRSDFEGQRFVGKILGHAGIPGSVVPEVIERLVLPAQRDPVRARLSAQELIRVWLQSGDCFSLDRTVERFLRYGGGAAEEYIQYLRAVVSHPEPARGKEHRISKERLRVGRERLRAREAAQTDAEARAPSQEDVVHVGSTATPAPQPSIRGRHARSDSTRPRRTLAVAMRAALTRRPRVVCLDDHGRWAIALQILGSEDVGRVSQSGSDLRSLGRGLFQLVDLRSDIVVQRGTGRIRCSLSQRSDRILVFRAGRNWEGAAFPCRTIAHGHYVAVVPDGWLRDERRAGVPSVAPEPTTVPGYRAHFFYLEEGGPGLGVCFRRPDGGLSRAGARGSLRFAAVPLHDPEGALPPIYLGEFPAAELLSGLQWDDVGAVSVRRSGGDASAVRVDRGALGAQGIVSFANIITASGEYTIDVLGEGDTLLATEQVRFLNGLRRVEVADSGPLPAGDGHRAAEIRFHRRHGVEITPHGDGAGFGVLSDDDLVTFSIPAAPSADTVAWTVRDGDYTTILQTVISRVWWRVRDEDAAEPGLEAEWTDRQVELRKGDFRPSSRKVLDIRLRKPSSLTVHGIGFGPANLRWCTSNDNTYSIPLRSFADDHHLSSGESERRLCLLASHEGHDEHAIVGVVPATVRCLVCRADVAKSDIASHIASHLDDLAPELTYGEVRERAMMDLPEKILSCPFCSFYVPVPVRRNPADEMLEHQKHACKGRNERRDTLKLGFRVVTDSAEIRSNVIPNLPHFWRCSRCGLEFSMETRGEIVGHLLREHAASILVTD